MNYKDKYSLQRSLSSTQGGDKHLQKGGQYHRDHVKFPTARILTLGFHEGKGFVLHHPCSSPYCPQWYGFAQNSVHWEPAQTGICKGSRSDCHLQDPVFSVHGQALWTAISTDQRGHKFIYTGEILIPLPTCHTSSTIQKRLISLGLCCRSPMEDFGKRETKAWK